MFCIGQKVVCVDARSPVIRALPSDMDLVEGHIYTVADSFRDILTDIPAVKLDGHSKYNAYQASRFRPVVEKKTDISVFTEILKRETVDDRAPAQVR